MSPRKCDIDTNDIDSNSPKQQQKQQQKQQLQTQGMTNESVWKDWNLQCKQNDFNSFINYFSSELTIEPSDTRFNKMFYFIKHNRVNMNGLLFRVRNLSVYLLNKSKISYAEKEFMDICFKNYFYSCNGEFAAYALSFLTMFHFIKCNQKTFRINLTNCNEFITSFSKFFQHTSGKTNIQDNDLGNFNVKRDRKDEENSDDDIDDV